RRPPGPRARARTQKIMEAVKISAEELANTATIWRKSYVHETVVGAFENGLLERFSSRLRRSPSPRKRSVPEPAVGPFENGLLEPSSSGLNRSRSQGSREQVLLQVMTLAA